ncbi:MAG TPA: SGNH/GDSL hydrolase family protein [Thermoanaerobaculia bacterium]
MHVVLLGDSIFDNAAYTRGEPDVVTHLRSVLPKPWRATLAAVDGAVIRNLHTQLRRVPDDATHLVISVGGNDALRSTDLLARPVRSTTETLLLFAERVEPFEADYREAIAAALSLDRKLTLCTIYNGNLGEQATVARIALCIFNDVIVRTALAHDLPLIDLRLVCTEPSDYANPIEPSGPGGLKIAQAIARSL